MFGTIFFSVLQEPFYWALVREVKVKKGSRACPQIIK